MFFQRLISGAGQDWQDYVRHDFVLQLARGTLPRIHFIHYLKQDYLYLFHYSRAFALAAYKGKSFEDIAEACRVVETILHETRLHIEYCQSWGIAKEDLFKVAESPACVAYTRYVLDCGMAGDLVHLYAAIAPCALGYAEIGRMIVNEGLSPEGNPYQAWIDSYASAEFQKSVAEIARTLERLSQGLSDADLARVQHIFNVATRMEVAFWQMGLDLA